MRALAAARVFDGARFHRDAAIAVEDGRVAAILRRAEAPPARDLGPVTLAPGFVDWQVNGGGGVLLNGDPTPEGIAAIAGAHAAFGTTALLPTLITDTPPVTDAAVEAVAAALRAGVPGVVGLHLEGPHISVARKGAHDPALIRPMRDADHARLARDDLGVRLATLAPETAGPEHIRRLATAGVLVSLGHSDAEYAAAMAGFAAGARAVTHLFNAMSPLAHRAPGLAGAALDHPDVTTALIADGHHIHPAAMRIALRAKPPGRLTLVTDAMSTVGAAGSRFELNGRSITRAGGRLTLADGTLAGSDLDMASAVRFCVERLDVPLAEALRMASLYPARLLGLASRGHLRPGACADIVALDRDLRPVGTWIGGQGTGETP
jgi:N-acetylglucosamine-6-phosphate deacetylase